VMVPLRNIYSIGKNLKNPVDVAPIAEFGQAVKKNLDQARTIFPIVQTVSLVQTLKDIPTEVSAAVSAVKAGIDAIPEPTVQENAKRTLVIADERLNNYAGLTASLRQKEEAATISARVHEVFNRETNDALEAIYIEVQELFTTLYTAVNEDEVGFRAELKPVDGKLGFDVDFYGKGLYPPGAYHSEGHQDGMGLCLYLALMKHLMKGGFTLAVLDDVLMSVDADHRRAVSEMLKTFFPTTQFILTTHDNVWLKHMKGVGLVVGKNAVHFRKWDVDFGPAEWDDKNVWEEIEVDVKSNKISNAAATLRHFLEYVSAEICDDLHAMVPYKADGRLTLGDLLPNAIATFKKRLQTARVAADSWGNTKNSSQIKAIAADLQVALKATSVEEWQINATVHYNEWANMHKKDFNPVAAAYQKLLKAFNCQDCGTPITVVPKSLPHEMLKCGCGACAFPLVPKLSSEGAKKSGT
ncbi:MAG: chromosome segregation protein SMC, partial [Micavibrio aeruginosavorus]